LNIGCESPISKMTGFFYLLKFIFMIYKFKNDDEKTLEVEFFNSTNFDEECIDVIHFTITNENKDSIYFEMTKSEVFKLIGALHLLHKEME